MNDKNKKPYSGIQKMFWVIAGSEISALEKCPNDYNRHANIGLMITITAFFAGATAFIAGKRFGATGLGALGFALVWAFLIFSLDRSMVNSIKKDPTSEESPFWRYFTARFILAIILAFFMSIPLDHLVFHERINAQMIKNNDQDWIKKQQLLNKGYDTKKNETNIGIYTKNVSEIEEELKNDCPLEEYQSKKREYSNCQYEEGKFRASYNNINSKYNSINRRINNGEEITMPSRLRSDRNNASIALRNKINECSVLKNDLDLIYKNWKLQKENDKARVDSLKRDAENRLIANNNTIQEQSDSFKKEIDDMKGFDTQFVTLFLMPNWGVQILKWLIFLALLVIEILPTFLKLKTPVGQYDWEMYKREQETEIETNNRIESFRSSAAAIENYRSENEISLNKKLIDKLVKIEENLANEMLEEWEIKAKSQMKNDIASS